MKYGKDIIGVGCWALIINEKNEILLLRRGNSTNWETPGGKVEFEESLKDALKREINEELNIKIQISSQFILDEIVKKEYHWLAFYYPSKITSGNPTIMEKKTHKELAWFPLSNPPEITESAEKAIKEYLGKQKS